MMNTQPPPTEQYASNASYADLASRLNSAKRIALVSHYKADGDSIGSMLALARAMQAQGKEALVTLTGPVDEKLLMLVGETPYVRIDSVDDAPEDDVFDLIVLVDTGAWSQLELVETWLRRNRDRVIGIDHHAHGDDVALDRVVDANCAATAQMIVQLLDVMNITITGGIESIGEALFLGLATATGWFRHSNAGAEVFSVAARLLDAGVDKIRLHQIIEESHRPQRLSLEARALASLTYAADQTVAIMSLELKDFTETGGLVEDLTGMVNLPLVVQRTQVSILLAQSEQTRTKASFRSKSSINPLDPDEFVDVNELARRFGGGGHVHAAGAKFDMDVAEARKLILQVLEQQSA